MNIVGIGTDVIECLRIAQLIERHHELFLTRVYTRREIEYCSARKMATQHYAARWAAKEAVLKSLGTGWSQGIQWTDIEVLANEGGQPRVCLTGAALRISQQMGIDEVLISLAHCRTHATAFAMSVRHPVGSDEGADAE